MKWSVYKRLSKEHKEEYNYKSAAEDKNLGYHAMITISFISAILGRVEISIFFLALTFLYGFYIDRKEKSWLKERGYK